MGQLIETLLNFSLLTRSSMTRTAVNLTESARELFNSLRLSDPSRQVTFVAADGLYVVGDPKLLGIVLDNLIGNAWKYTGRRETAQIEFGSTLVSGETVFFVRDNGEGFDMAHAGKLFRPFERLPGTNGIPGHGIGLATVQRIIQRHGGTVWAEAEPGKGATFFFKL
jgi:signal transduction histidine kinase